MSDFVSCPAFTGFLGSEYKAKNPQEVGSDGVIKVCIAGGAGFIGSHIAKKLKTEVSWIFYLKLLIFSNFL